MCSIFDFCFCKRYDGANAIWKEIAAKYEIVAKEREARLEPPPVVEEKVQHVVEEKVERAHVVEDIVMEKKPIKWNPSAEFVPRFKTGD